MQGVVFQVHLWTLNWSSHAEELTRSKCNECDGNLGLYLQHFFSFILTSVFFASAEFAEPLSIWVLDMLKCVLSLPHRRPGWSENRGIRHIAASVYGFFFCFFFLHYVKNAAFFFCIRGDSMQDATTRGKDGDERRCHIICWLSGTVFIKAA